MTGEGLSQHTGWPSFEWDLALRACLVFQDNPIFRLALPQPCHGPIR